MRKLVTRATAFVAAALFFVTGNASASAVVDPCDDLHICLYYSTDFRDFQFETGIRDRCWDLENYGVQHHVWSFRNRMRIGVHFESENGARVWDVGHGEASPNSKARSSSERWLCTY